MRKAFYSCGIILLMEKIRIRDIMNTSPVMINKKASVLDATKEMKSEKVGSIIVVEDGKPIGIVTESDILREIVAEERDPKKIPVDEIMSAPPVTISPDDEIYDAVKMMGKHRIRRLPVVESEKIIGMVTERDIMQFSPLLRDILEEWAEITKQRIEYKREGKFISGKCEECGMLSRQLVNFNGRLLCEFCLERMR
ncbi:MAG: CBS domain-containing protein [Thermoplasmata archaeon]|nr:MAG: CBS domain-containing protein [Thermoplasmata archaeon]